MRLSVAAADLFGRGDEGGPDRGRCSLGDRLELEGRPALGRQLGVDPRHGRLELAGLQMAAEPGHDSARVQRRRPHPARLMPPVELHREQDVGGLGPAIGNHRVVGRALEIGIVEVDVRIAVAGGGDIHQPAARREQRGDAVHQHEVAEVICPELGLEAIGGVPEGRPHHAGIGDHGGEGPPVSDQRVGTGAHTLKRGEIQLHQLQSAAVRRLRPDLGGRPLRLGEVARGADHVGPMDHEGAGRLHTKAGRHAGDEHALSVEILAQERYYGATATRISSRSFPVFGA
jgi:hypothetical protein